MSTSNHIVDTSLPLSQDFNSLKEQGLAYLQEHMNYEWTNLNASDPGITILDQICYALTELGYCDDFPLKDILTEKDGTLSLENQFYLPENILTTSPVNDADYRKYLVDGVEGVSNAILLQAMKGSACIPQVYQVYLLIDESVTDADLVCKAAFAYLNDARNAGELFLMPVPLVPYNVSLSGTIDISNTSELDTILASINQSIRNYIFPEVRSQGYRELTASGVHTNDIFDGPLLQHGWIPTNTLGEKRDQLSVLELMPLIDAVPGVNSVSALNFLVNGQPVSSPVTCNANELFTMDVAAAFAAGTVTITCNNRTVGPNGAGNATSPSDPGYETNILFGASVDVQSDVPQGKFRDINTYYSVQNTFPEVYALGADSVNTASSDFQVAQVRQLKGYLLLFDQTLANQFSQLANIPQLFSFKNSLSGTPSDVYTYRASKDKLSRNDYMYPAPYLRFAPTYFYQSLYHIPEIRPLLKDNDAFGFSLTTEPEKVMEENSWEKYKLDPYNAYIHGLMGMMENENTSLRRRNDMLDHLLARHGESPVMIDSYIDGSRYTGDPVKDKVIFKSLYLQNLGLLSYYRYKGFNYLSAETLGYRRDKKETELPVFNEDAENNILDGYTDNFIFDSEKIDWTEKIEKKDFINFSGIELKLNLLFGLKVVYRNFIVSDEKADEATEPVAGLRPIKQQALWFIRKRRGCVLIEMPLLLQYFQFEMVITNATSQQTWQITQSMDYATTAQVIAGVAALGQNSLDTQLTGTTPTLTINDQPYTLNALSPVVTPGKSYHNLKGTDYYYLIKAVGPTGVDATIELEDFQRRLEFLFPDFISEFVSVPFRNRINFFLGNELPVNAPFRYALIRATDTNELITAFVAWHESMRCSDLSDYPNPDSVQCAWNLLNELAKTYTTPAQ